MRTADPQYKEVYRDWHRKYLEDDRQQHGIAQPYHDATFEILIGQHDLILSVVKSVDHQIHTAGHHLQECFGQHLLANCGILQTHHQLLRHGLVANDGEGMPAFLVGQHNHSQLFATHDLMNALKLQSRALHI